MKLNRIVERTPFSIKRKAGFAVILTLFLVAGCLPSAKAPHLVDQYTLDYTPPAGATGTPFADSLKVERFSVAQAYNTTAMIYRPSAYRLSSYGYARWRVNPGDLITDYLARDFRSSGMFLGIFTYRDADDARFVVQGTVEEFLEADDGKEGKAVVIVSISLLDTKETEITKKLVFQRTYKAAEPMNEQSSMALAQGMSAAVKTVSGQVSRDISESVRRLGIK
jgi:ABC-type uncharacterized transport system auxiliary subunit